MSDCDEWGQYWGDFWKCGEVSGRPVFVSDPVDGMVSFYLGR
ncbi:MAG TPA: hypothetical protein VLR88_07520 [Propionibacteriaceae bacterium]|nr:hypothetical protein [Propionibacteriaceae bacterium]